MRHAKRMFKRLKGLKRVTPGERQAGPPRRSDGCGLGVAFACATPGERQAGPPRRSDGCDLERAVEANGRLIWSKLPRSIEAFEAKKDKFHTCGGPRRRPCLGEGRGRQIYLSIFIYLYLYLSIYIYIYLYLYLSLSIYTYLYLSISTSIYLYLSISI